MCCLFPSLAPTGKNIQDDEFNALGDMLARAKWDLPEVEEYKGDLVMPSFLPQSLGNQVTPNQVAPSAKPDPDGPPSAEQWAKVQKMVA